jgi:uncharacterized membrane protein (DUF4010 family)
MKTDWLDMAGLGLLPVFATSLAIGLLIGLERERAPNAKAGLRTTALVCLFGTLCALTGEILHSPWIPAAGLAIVGLMMVSAYHRDSSDTADPGTTTIVVVVLSFMLGVLTYLGQGNLAVALALAVTTLLYFKPELRGILQRFNRRDLLSLLQFGAVTFVVLPILPDQGYGPYGALNPHRIWLMVVLVSGIGLAGYIALRLTSQRKSATMLGVFGGLVSTTATTVLFSRHGRSPEMLPLAVRVILIANLVLLIRLSLLAAVVAGGFLPVLLPVLGAALATGTLATLAASKNMMPRDVPVAEMANPTELRTALGFGAAFGSILFLSAWLTDIAGNSGLYLVAAASGLADVDAIALSALQLFELDNISKETALVAIMLALLVNQATKLMLVLSIGGTVLFRRCAIPMAVTSITAAVATYVMAAQ